MVSFCCCLEFRNESIDALLRDLLDPTPNEDTNSSLDLKPSVNVEIPLTDVPAAVAATSTANFSNLSLSEPALGNFSSKLLPIANGSRLNTSDLLPSSNTSHLEVNIQNSTILVNISHPNNNSHSNVSDLVSISNTSHSEVDGHNSTTNVSDPKFELGNATENTSPISNGSKSNGNAGHATGEISV